MIFIDPEDETTVSDFIEIFGRGVHVVWPDDTLGDVLRELKSGRSHMALVRDVEQSDDNQDPYYEIKGIITLEDIIEEILGTCIYMCVCSSSFYVAFVECLSKSNIFLLNFFLWYCSYVYHYRTRNCR